MTQIGLVGLGKMGGNMVRRIRRDSDHEVVAFDFDGKAVKQAVRNGAAGLLIESGHLLTAVGGAPGIEITHRDVIGGSGLQHGRDIMNLCNPTTTDLADSQPVTGCLRAKQAGRQKQRPGAGGRPANQHSIELAP